MVPLGLTVYLLVLRFRCVFGETREAAMDGRVACGNGFILGGGRSWARDADSALECGQRCLEMADCFSVKYDKPPLNRCLINGVRWLNQWCHPRQLDPSKLQLVKTLSCPPMFNTPQCRKVCPSRFPNDANTVLLMEFYDNGSEVITAAGQVEDKSASANHGAAQVDLELVNVTSLGRRGLRLNGAGGIHVPHSTSLDLKGDLTIEIWVKPDHEALDTGYVTLKKSCFGYPQFKNANQATGFIYVGNRALTDNFMFATHASGGGADYYVMVVEGSRVSYYLNIMTVQGEDFTGQTPRGTSSEPLLIGESADLNGANKFFKGVLFGLRISKIARTYSDLKAMYKTGCE